MRLKGQTSIKRMVRDTVRNRLFRLLVQPIVDLKTGSPFGYEFLTRGPTGPLEHPESLFKAAFRVHALADLEAAVCEDAAKWAARDLAGHKVFINVSPQTFTAEGDRVRKVMAVYKPQNIVIELTEAQALDTGPTGIEAARRWREAGYELALDDIGSGYSRLVAAAQLSPSYIKIDRPLVAGAARSARWRVVMEQIVAMSNRLGAEVIAEGVETESELALVREMSIPLAQGFKFARPAEISEALAIAQKEVV